VIAPTERRVRLAALVFLVLAALPAAAQPGPELTLSGGFQMLGSTGGTLTVPPGYDVPEGRYSGDINIRDSVVYAATLDVPLAARPGTRLQLLYSLQPTRLQFKSNLTYELGDVTVHYFQVGGLVEKAAPGADLVPFGGFLVGAVYYDIASNRWEDEWKFAATLTLGATKFVSPKVGLRLRGDLLLPIDFGGAGFYFGTGGASVGVGGTSLFTQLTFSGGVTIRLG